MTSKLPNYLLSEGTNVTVTVSVADAFASIASVELFNRSNLLATLTSGPYNFSVSTTNTNYFILTALAGDTPGNTRYIPAIVFPVFPNTSGDGRNDALDIMLGLDPSTNTTPLNPTNHTPPTINLLLPTDATPVP